MRAFTFDKLVYLSVCGILFRGSADAFCTVEFHCSAIYHDVLRACARADLPCDDYRLRRNRASAQIFARAVQIVRGTGGQRKFFHGVGVRKRFYGDKPRVPYGFRVEIRVSRQSEEGKRCVYHPLRRYVYALDFACRRMI